MFSLRMTAFIGGGVITRSLLSGFKKKYSLQQLIVSDLSPEKLGGLADEFGIRVAKSNIEAVTNADVAVLAIKPQFTKDVCKELSPVVKIKKTLIISLVSATPVEDIYSWLAADNLPIIRTMPNTASAVGMGTTALFANNFVTPEQKTFTETFFNAIGSSFWVQQESDLNAFSPIVGCAPAYLFLLIEALQKAAVAQGMSEELARKTALETVCGAAELAKQSNLPAEELRRQVTTPKGITEASLKPLFAGNYFHLFQKAFEEAEKRCNEIEASFRTQATEAQSSVFSSRQSFFPQPGITSNLPNNKNLPSSSPRSKL